MKPKKANVERAVKNGSLNRVNQLLSLSLLLNTISNGLADEAADILREHNLLIGPVKQKHTAMMKAADAFFFDFSLMINQEQQKKDMFEDIDTLRGSILRWAHLDKPFQPKDINQSKQEES